MQASLFVRIVLSQDSSLQSHLTLTSSRAAQMYRPAYSPLPAPSRAARGGRRHPQHGSYSDGSNGSAEGPGRSDVLLGRGVDPEAELQASMLAHAEYLKLRAQDTAGPASGGGEEGTEDGAGVEDVTREGVTVSLEQLTGWRPVSAPTFSAAVRRRGASPLLLHLSLVGDGARLP